jgi:hypothetical protein
MVDIFKDGECCVRCTMAVYYHQHSHAIGMGHIYSPEGKSEFRISGLCEWCFDEICDVEIIHGKDSEQ